MRSTYGDWDKYGDSEEAFLKRKIDRVKEMYEAGTISFEEYIDDTNQYSMDLYKAQENKKNILDDLRATDIDISAYVDSISTSISNSGTNIESLLGELLSAFKGFKVEAPSTTYADNRVVNLSGMTLSEFAAKYMGEIG